MGAILVLAVAAAIALVSCAGTPSGGTEAAQTSNAGQFHGSGFAACPPAARTAAGNAAKSAGQRLPAVPLTCMDGSGRSVRLDQLTGRPMVVNLWASWCQPCGQELPAFARLAASAGQTLVVLGVSTKDDPGRAVAAGRDVGVRFANVFDPDVAVERSLGRTNLPITLLIGPDGVIRHVYAGPVLTDAALAQLVQQYLGVPVR
ncbi:TlpA family protein disulfide reductase [Fodinicola feengrottensis]|uniref:TlpA family protein disulfide reductase n=1 Tax=Fodinicola feengrottensis TaxID=435914 RepID=UPI0013D548A7|nr:TlpA disulfide reductase family protein [Fodinicola feengrottensis]